MDEFKPVIKIPEFRIKYKDVFHLKNLYVMMHEYLTEEGFLDTDQAQNNQDGHRYAETLYMDKNVQKGLHQGGKELWLWWRTIKQPETKYSGYFRYHLDFDLHIVYLKDQEVVHQGRKMKIQSGEIEIFIRPKIVADYREEWKDHWLMKHFHKLYFSRIVKYEFEKREKQLWRESYRFHAKIKQFLSMRTFIPVSDAFWTPIYGYEKVE